MTFMYVIDNWRRNHPGTKRPLVTLSLLTAGLMVLLSHRQTTCEPAVLHTQLAISKAEHIVEMYRAIHHSRSRRAPAAAERAPPERTHGTGP